LAFGFIRLDGARIESWKAERTWWGSKFSVEERTCRLTSMTAISRKCSVCSSRQSQLDLGYLEQREEARFDLALTVCTMRYISDMRIGRINPKHFAFGLDVSQKKLDLPDFRANL